METSAPSVPIFCKSLICLNADENGSQQISEKCAK
jgi:hypothetical protein